MSMHGTKLMHNGSTRDEHQFGNGLYGMHFYEFLIIVGLHGMRSVNLKSRCMNGAGQWQLKPLEWSPASVNGRGQMKTSEENQMSDAPNADATPPLAMPPPAHN